MRSDIILIQFVSWLLVATSVFSFTLRVPSSYSLKNLLNSLLLSSSPNLTGTGRFLNSDVLEDASLITCDRQSEWQENAKQCSQKHNVPIEEIQKAMTGGIKPADITPAYKCMILCMSDKEGITKDGVLQPQALTEKLANAPNKDNINKAIAACKDVKGTDSCDTSYKVMTCLIMNKGM